MTNRDEFASLVEEINNSVAIKVHLRLEKLRINFFLFNRNYEELKKVIDVSKNPEQMLSLWNLKNRRKLNIVLDEISRLLLNYLASVKSLVDHTRLLINDWYQGTEFLREYEKETNTRFVNNPLIGFVEGLRNYSLHYSLPVANATLSASIEEGRSNYDSIDFSFVIVKSNLLNWSRWPKKSEAYLNEADDEIDINNLVTCYYQQVRDFHTWMFSKLKEVHADELDWLNEMQNRVMELMDDDEVQARGLDDLKK